MPEENVKDMRSNLLASPWPRLRDLIIDCIVNRKTCIMMGPNIKISLPAQRLRTSMDNMETQPLDLSEVPELDEEDL